MPETANRTLAAVMFTDMVGFTALMQQNEALARQKRDRHREVLERSHQTHHGEIINYFGDGSLSIFHSAVEAVTCAVEIQQQLRQPPQVELRIGIHMGDVILEQESVFGDTVNVASRIESFSVPGAVMISGVVYDQVKNHSTFDLCQLGKFQMKNVDRPVELFAVANEGIVVPELADLQGKGEYIDEAKALLHNIPHQISSFVGRQKEIEEINTLLSQYRLVTLTGPGGTGKTRLSQQVAHKAALNFPDGVFWIPLAAIFDPGLVAFTIAKGLQLEQDALLSIEEMLIRFFKDKKILLLLDNFEQIVAAAPLVEHLLEQCPKIKVLVTSRIILQLIGEAEYAVKPLPLPKNGTASAEQLKEYPAIQLFYERSRAARKRFELNEENAPVVAAICKKLDGLPLAIELAAARIKIFSPKAMLKRLNQRLDLKSSSTSLPSRHQTIRSTIAWSYDLLETEEKELFSRMSVFVGGANMEAVEEVCGLNGLGDWDVVDGVLALVDKSLIQQEEDEELEARFTMLETIREFASESLRNLAREEPLQGAHARYFLELAEEANPHLSGSEQSEWLAVLEAEQENFRAAINNSIRQGNYEMAFRLGLALRPFWGNRGMTMEGVQQLEKLLELPAEDELYQWRLKVMQALGILYFYIPKFPQAREMLTECLAYWKTTPDRKQTGSTLNNLTWATLQLGKFTQAEKLIPEALQVAADSGDDHLRLGALNNHGWVKMWQGRPAEALPFFEETLQITKALRDERRYGYAMLSKSKAFLLKGDYQQSIDLARTALEIHQRNKDKLLMAFALIMIGYCRSRLGQYEESVQLATQVEPMARDVNANFWTAAAADLRSLAALAEDKLEEARHWNEKSLDIAERVKAHIWICLDWYTKGKIALAGSDLVTLRESHTRLLQLDYNEGSYMGIVPGLELKAQALIWDKNFQKAIQCLAKAGALREGLQFALPPVDAPAIDQCKTKLRQFFANAFDKLWKEGRQMPLQQLLK